MNDEVLQRICNKCLNCCFIQEFYVIDNNMVYPLDSCKSCQISSRLQIAKEKATINAVATIKNRISGQIRSSLKVVNNYYIFDVISYLPYTAENLKTHIESQFEPWMTWYNWGKYVCSTWNDNDPSTWKWQIDHIVPKSDFNYTAIIDKEFQDCWSLSNLRPLSAKQNLLDGVSRVRHVK